MGLVSVNDVIFMFLLDICDHADIVFQLQTQVLEALWLFVS